MVPPIRRPMTVEQVVAEWAQEDNDNSRMVYCLCGTCDHCVKVADSYENDYEDDPLC